MKLQRKRNRRPGPVSGNLGSWTPGWSISHNLEVLGIPKSMKVFLSIVLVSCVAAQVTISRTISGLSGASAFVSLASGCTEHGALLRSLWVRCTAGWLSARPRLTPLLPPPAPALMLAPALEQTRTDRTTALSPGAARTPPTTRSRSRRRSAAAHSTSTSSSTVSSPSPRRARCAAQTAA